MNLTKKTVESMTYKGKPLKSGFSQDLRWDDKLKGFGVRVYPSGQKIFILSYRHDGRKHIYTIGKFGVLTVDQARDLARERLVDLTKGADPFADRKKSIAGDTMADLCADYMKRHAEFKKSKRDDERRINKTILPKWKNIKVVAITDADVSALFHRVTDNGIYEANRLLALLHKLFELAKKWGYTDKLWPNPAHGIEKHREMKRDRWVTHEELPKLAESIDKEENTFARYALWLYLLTGMRKTELLSLKWSDIDFSRREIRLEDTKAGRTHYIPLGAEALTILEGIPRFDDNPYVLCGAKQGAHLVNIGKIWRRVRKAAGADDVRLHDLRRTVGSWLAQSGNSLHLIGRVLNHSNVSTTQVYARFGQDHVREALEAHGKQIMGIAGKRPLAEVVELKKAVR